MATRLSSIAMTAASNPRPAHLSSELKYGADKRQTVAIVVRMVFKSGSRNAPHRGRRWLACYNAATYGRTVVSLDLERPVGAPSRDTGEGRRRWPYGLLADRAQITSSCLVLGMPSPLSNIHLTFEAVMVRRDTYFTTGLAMAFSPLRSRLCKAGALSALLSILVAGSANAAEVSAQPQPAGGAGMKAYIDPQTGAQRSDPAPGTQIPAPSPAQSNAQSTSSAGLVEVPSSMPGGGVKVDLLGRFQSPLISTIGPDGAAHMHHAGEDHH
jgi:hypothetical protein